jgi:hypothetical protein
VLLECSFVLANWLRDTLCIWQALETFPSFQLTVAMSGAFVLIWFWIIMGWNRTEYS